MKAMRFATVKLGNAVLHTVPQGNRHTLCGRVAEHGINGDVAARSVAAGVHRLCKSCVKVTPARDHTAVDMGAPTDTWTVKDKAGNRLGRVTARDIETAGRRARQVPSIAFTARREGGLSLRRLFESEL